MTFFCKIEAKCGSKPAGGPRVRQVCRPTESSHPERHERQQQMPHPRPRILRIQIAEADLFYSSSVIIVRLSVLKGDRQLFELNLMGFDAPMVGAGLKESSPPLTFKRKKMILSL